MAQRRVEVLEKKIVYDFQKIRFRVEEVRLKHERLDGRLSEPLTRLNLDRGDGAAAVLFDPQAKTILLIEQFRYSTHEKGHGWLWELPAGIVNPDEQPAETMRRELVEETGYQVPTLRHVYTFYLSPGGSSERIFLYYAEVSPKLKTSAGGGLPAEQEEIRLHVTPLSEALAMIERGQICDAKTIIGLQWLRLRQ
jgi:ADP-ribose pyrophosphatase